MKQHNYNVRWSNGGPSIANVSFAASHDYNAKKQIDRIAKDLNLVWVAYTVTKDGQLINL